MKDLFSDLYKTIELRKKSNTKNSYTKKLFKEGEKKIAQKFGEESTELIVDYLKGNKKRTIEEAADVIYHLCVLLSSKKIGYADIKKEIEKFEKNENVNSYILDLRNNPGGLLSQAIRISDFLIILLI